MYIALFFLIAEVSLFKHPSLHYYGVSGTTSIYNPKCSIAQASSTHIFIQNGEGDGTNIIYVGWQVFPHVYGDDKTHLYLAWTSDNFKKTGCYDMQYQGFVQTGDHHHVGEVIQNISVYGGPMVEMSISIPSYIQFMQIKNTLLRSQRFFILFICNTFFFFYFQFKFFIFKNVHKIIYSLR
ncbi:putative neprosin [Medicago truncatula]|uniref:Putative neprosin n=1 Tax=Medicago truncatula TaxID=3880 RepID=A0A396HWM0_MEDTR|nr:putative neprosin [Medicago truncatula]